MSGGRKTANEIVRLHGSREQCTVHGQALGYARVLSLGGQVGELGRLRDALVVDEAFARHSRERGGVQRIRHGTSSPFGSQNSALHTTSRCPVGTQVVWRVPEVCRVS